MPSVYIQIYTCKNMRKRKKEIKNERKKTILIDLNGKMLKMKIFGYKQIQVIEMRA